MEENEMARIAYIRVSTEEQDTMRQEDLMAGQNIDRYYIEKISGKNADLSLIHI